MNCRTHTSKRAEKCKVAHAASVFCDRERSEHGKLCEGVDKPTNKKQSRIKRILGDEKGKPHPRPLPSTAEYPIVTALGVPSCTVDKRAVPIMDRHHPDHSGGRYRCVLVTKIPPTMADGAMQASPSVWRPDIRGDEPLHA